MSDPTVIDDIFRHFGERGHLDYGESISVAEHMLQTACFAERDEAPPLLVAAALLHDYGHLVHGLPEDIADRGIDGTHEEAGARSLEEHFVAAVTEPTRLHVAAKRYLCAVEPDYLQTLSPASIKSLKLQGGPYTPTEVEEFEAGPHGADAVRLRRYDDMGKVPGMETPDLEHFRPVLDAGLRPSP